MATILSNSNILDFIKDSLKFFNLSTLEIAKLLPFMQEEDFSKGQKIFEKDRKVEKVFIVLKGCVNLSQNNNIFEIVENKIIGDNTEFYKIQHNYDAIANEDVKIISIKKSSFFKILEKKDPSTEEKETFAYDYFSNKRTVDKNEKKILIKKTIGWILSIITPLLILLIFSKNDIHWDLTQFIAIISVNIIMLIFDLLPFYLPSIVSLTALIMLKVAPVNIILSGFADNTFFLFIGIFGLSAVLNISGLVFRLSLLILKYLPSKNYLYPFYLSFLALSISSCMTSRLARQSLLSNFFSELVHNLKLKPEDKSYKALVIALFYGNNAFLATFLTSSIYCLLAFSMFPNQVKEQFSWFYWVFAASFYIIGMLIFFLLTFFFLCRKDKNLISIKDTAKKQLKILGKLSFLEKGAILGVLLLIFGIITEQIHQIPISWIALGILSLLLYLGILNNKSFQNKIPWPLILSLGIFISILKTLKYLEADDLLKTQINFLANFMDGNIFIFILVLAALMSILNLFCPYFLSISAIIAYLFPTAINIGFNVWVLSFIVITFTNLDLILLNKAEWKVCKSLIKPEKNFSEIFFIGFSYINNIAIILCVFLSVILWKFLDLL